MPLKDWMIKSLGSFEEPRWYYIRYAYTEILIFAGDLSGHWGRLWEYKGLHGGFEWGKKQGSSMILDFGYINLIIVNGGLFGERNKGVVWFWILLNTSRYMKRMNIWLFINPSSLLIMPNLIQISLCWWFSYGSSDFRASSICFQYKHAILKISFFIQQIKTDWSLHFDWCLLLFFSIFMCILYNCNTWELDYWQETKVWWMILSTIALLAGIHVDHNALLYLKVLFWSFTWSFF